MGAFTFEPDEEELGSWTVNYKPPWGGRYTGKLFVTDRRLLYDAKFDTSAMGIATSSPACSRRATWRSRGIASRNRSSTAAPR